MEIENSDRKIIVVELADNPVKRILGLMFRKKLDSDGMFFVFPKPARYCFWMLFTGIPLDIIFISENDIVDEIIQMKPYSCEQICPKKPARYVLEVEMRKLNVNPGKTRIFVKN